MVEEIHDIVTSLLNSDGSCRDLNFESPTWNGVQAILVHLGESFTGGSATDHDGNEINKPFPELLLGLAPGGGRAVLEGGTPPITRLQIFVFAEDDGTPFVELTFFPDDVELTKDLRRDFLEWAKEIKTRLQARRYYARYENASWRFGDTGPESGVFLMSNNGGTNA